MPQELIIFDSAGKRRQRLTGEAKRRLSASEILRMACCLVVASPGSAEPPRVSMVKSLSAPFPAPGREIAVWLVDGGLIRKNIDEEFTNFGHHGRHGFIPDGEFWIDQESSPEEHGFFIANMVADCAALSRGATPDAAMAEAEAAEMNARMERGDPSMGVGPQRVHRHLWRRARNGVEVWLVDGRMVRSAIDVGFTCGGHDNVYPYIPTGEVWIDDCVRAEERDLVLVHELHERGLMANGMGYDQAHEEASKVELRCRWDQGELRGRLDGMLGGSRKEMVSRRDASHG